MANQEVLLTVKDDIAYITLNRPKYGNSLNLDTVKALLNAVIYCDENYSIRCVVLSGIGNFFCTGGDIGEFESNQEHIQGFLSQLAGLLNLSISRLIRMNKPLVVAVNGTAAGAGMSLALIGDVVIATENAIFSPAYSAIGLSPDAGLTWFLPKLVGLRRAQKILYENLKINADDALTLGLVTEVVPNDKFDQIVKNVANNLSNLPLSATSNVRHLLLSSQHNQLETHLELEARLIAKISTERSAQEGLRAYKEKRPANFKI